MPALVFFLIVFFLIGEASLLAQDEPARPPRSLEEKMQRFHRHAEKWQRISRIMKDFHPLVQQGQFARAETLLDRALGVLEAGPGDPGNDPGNMKQLDQFRRKADETQYLVLPLKEVGHLYGGRVAEFEEAVKKMVRLQPSEVALVDFGVLWYDLRAWRHAGRF